MAKIAIVCIDDEAIILDSLGRQLKRNLGQNYAIELASSGQEALAICKELETEGTAIALIISDHIMPGMSGDELLIGLHDIYPKALKILLTGKAGANSVGNIVNADALYRYISKPWEETDLILTVKEALRCYGQQQQLAEQNSILEKTNKLLNQSNQKLSRSLNILLATLEAADDGILVLDSQNNVVIFNQQFFTLWEIAPPVKEQDSNWILNLISQQLISPIACDLKAEESHNHSKKYNLLKLHNGKILESYFQIQQLENEEVGLVWGFRDVTPREQPKVFLNYETFHDNLTKLPRRKILTNKLSKAIDQAKQNSYMLAVIFVDLNRFKKINETLGYQVGDLLLQQVGNRLKDCIREDDTIARWGNDEFTLLLPKINNPDETNVVANRLIAAFQSPFHIANKPIHITLSIGIATYPQHGRDAETLLKNADLALSQAQKLRTHNYQYYNPNFSSQTHDLLTLENLLYSALKNQEFIIYYQPIVNVLTGKIAKMEALLRWNNPQLGLVPPYIFIPLAEENGSIVPIGEWVLQTACIQNKTWQNMGFPPIKMSVNLSVRQFQQPNLVSTVINILEQTQLQPSCLELEITESITMQNTQFTKTILTKLARMGINLSMDDFGTGYSSLSYLKQFPFHTLKIDRSFVKDLHSDSPDIAIVNAVITLGKGLNLNVVAEGVETEELKNLLKNLGCEYIQGYLFSKPVPAEEATKLLEQY